MLGVPLPSRTFVELGTVVLALVAVWAMGPLRVLRALGVTGREGAISGSVIVMRTRGVRGWGILEPILVAASLAWSIFPLYMGARVAMLDVAWSWAVVAVVLGIVASLVFGAISAQLRWTRRR